MLLWVMKAKVCLSFNHESLKNTVYFTKSLNLQVSLQTLWVTFQEGAHVVSLKTAWKRSPGHSESSPTSILPVSGWKPLAGSSVVTLHWMAQPFTRILSCLRFRSGRLRPSHTCSWACTRSTLWKWEGSREVNQVIDGLNIVWTALNFPWCQCGEHFFSVYSTV